MCVCVRVYGSQGAKGRIAKGDGASTNKQRLAILLLRAGLVVVGEPGLLWHSNLCSWVHLVVKLHGVVGILEVVGGFALFAVLLCNPIPDLGALLLVLRVVALILLKSKIVAFLFIQRGLAAVAAQILREVVASDEGGRVQHGPANHDSDSCHRVYVMFHVLASVRVRSHVHGEYLLVLEILLQCDAARHDDCELDVVHSTSAGVFGQVFLDDLAPNPANPSDKAGNGCGVE